VDTIVATMVDVVFPLSGACLPREHRQALADALERALPGLTAWPGLGVHRVNVVAGGTLLSQRARLALRVRREQQAGLAPLNGARLEVGHCAVQLGQGQVRELLAHGTLYSHLVSAGSDDEIEFQAGVERELESLGVRGRAICGRRHVVSVQGEGDVTGFSLMLDGLSPADSLQVLEAGLGRHRALGCGVFVPHRSAAALRA
jgi:CRISPR-associated protein Cas6